MAMFKYLIACSAILCSLPGWWATSVELDEFAEKANIFATKLYQGLRKNSEGNLAVSPISLELLLAQMYVGAGGRTASQIATALGLPTDRKQILQSHKNTMDSLQTPELKVANGIFLEKAFDIKKNFVDESTGYFATSLSNLNFEGNPEGSRSAINRWVEERTNDKIQDLLAQGSLDQSTKLVLVNVIHFKADWLRKFPKRNTHKQHFYVTPNEIVDVDMMFTNDDFKHTYHSGLQAQILEIPYKAMDFRMIVILPDEKDGLANVESKLSSFNLAEEIKHLKFVEIEVALPTFKLEETMKLNGVLTEMGLTDMFSSGANFSGITGSKGLRVSTVIQKTVIEVDEEGTEAAAGSGGVFLLSGGRRRFIANHPFIINIFYKDLLLFMGSVKKF